MEQFVVRNGPGQEDSINVTPFNANNTLKLQRAYPDQSKEIQGWADSLYTVGYVEREGKLVWYLDETSKKKLDDQIQQLFGITLETLVQEVSTPAPETLGFLLSKRKELFEGAIPLFTCFLLLNTRAQTITSILEQLHGNVRVQFIDQCENKLTDLTMGRPIIELDARDYAITHPSSWQMWAQQGWLLFVEQWGQCQTPADREDLIKATFNNPKGYSRAVGYLIDHTTRESIGETIKHYLRRGWDESTSSYKVIDADHTGATVKRFEGSLADIQKEGSDQYLRLWATVISEMCKHDQILNAKPEEEWLSYLKSREDEFQKALEGIFTPQQIADFLANKGQHLSKVMEDILMYY